MDWLLVLEIGVPVLLLLIPIIRRMIPSDSPAAAWYDIGTTILMKILKSVLADKTKDKFEDGSRLTHEDVAVIEKIKKDKDLLNRFRLGNKD